MSLLKKVMPIIFSLVIILLFTNPIYSKTTFEVSFRKSNLSVSEEKAGSFATFISDLVTTEIEPIIKKELEGEALDVLVQLAYDELMEILNSEDPDVIEQLGVLLRDNILEKEDRLIEPALDAVIASVNNALEFELKLYLDPNNPTAEALLSLMRTQVQRVIEDDINTLLIDFFNNDFVTIIEENASELLLGDNVTVLLENMISSKMPALLNKLVDKKMPGLTGRIKNFVFGLLPEELELYIVGFNLKTDITPRIALGVGVKGVGFDDIFIPEISLSLHFKIFNNSSFYWDIGAIGQYLISPERLDNIPAVTLGTSINWSPYSFLSLNGEFSAGSILGDNLNEDFNLLGSIPRSRDCGVSRYVLVSPFEHRHLLGM